MPEPAANSGAGGVEERRELRATSPHGNCFIMLGAAMKKSDRLPSNLAVQLLLVQWTEQPDTRPKKPSPLGLFTDPKDRAAVEILQAIADGRLDAIRVFGDDHARPFRPSFAGLEEPNPSDRRRAALELDAFRVVIRDGGLAASWAGRPGPSLPPAHPAKRRARMVEDMSAHVDPLAPYTLFVHGTQFRQNVLTRGGQRKRAGRPTRYDRSAIAEPALKAALANFRDGKHHGHMHAIVKAVSADEPADVWLSKAKAILEDFYGSKDAIGCGKGVWNDCARTLGWKLAEALSADDDTGTPSRLSAADNCR